MEKLDEKYLYLFNVLTDALDRIEALKQALQKAQETTESMYVEEE